MILHQGAQAHGGDHAIQHDAGAAEHAIRHGFHHADGLAEEADRDGDEGRQPQGGRIVVAGGGENGGVLRIGGVGRAAEQAGGHGGQAVAQHGAVQAGILGKVLANHRAVGVHVAHVLHAGDDGDGGDHADGLQVKLGQNEVGNFDPAVIGDFPHIHQRGRGQAGLGQNQGQDITGRPGR